MTFGRLSSRGIFETLANLLICAVPPSKAILLVPSATPRTRASRDAVARDALSLSRLASKLACPARSESYKPRKAVDAARVSAAPAPGWRSVRLRESKTVPLWSGLDHPRCAEDFLPRIFEKLLRDCHLHAASEVLELEPPLLLWLVGELRVDGELAVAEANEEVFA